MRPGRPPRLPASPCPGFVIDHIIALKHGGQDNPSNTEWQFRLAVGYESILEYYCVGRVFLVIL